MSKFMSTRPTQRCTSALVALALLSQLAPMGTSAWAQQRPAGAVVPGVGIPIVTAQPGAYEIRNTDTTPLLQQVLSRIAQIQDSDRKYLEESVQAVNTAYNEYMQLIISGELKQLSDRSQLGNMVPAEEYLRVVNKINEARLAFDSKIFALTSVSQGALPSAQQVDVAGTQQSLPGYRQINFQPLLSFYQQRIEAVTMVGQNYGIKIALPRNQGVQIIAPNSGQTLAGRLEVALLTADEIRTLQRQAEDLMTPTEELERLSDSQANELKRLILAFATNYGTSERYRFKDQADREARDRAFTDIVNAFWARSYLRAKYGVRIGAVQPAQYQKRWANIEVFMASTEALRNFRQERALTETELANALENSRNTLELLDSRSKEIFGGNASLLVRAQSLMTFLGGHSQTAEALLMIHRLIAADIQEEMSLTQGGGLQRLFNFYQTRYQSTEENRNYYRTLRCGMDPGTQGCAAGSFADTQSLSGGGLRAVFMRMNNELRANSAQLEQARRIMEQIRLAQISQGGASGQAVDDRAGRL